jgi:hypothetical protein
MNVADLYSSLSRGELSNLAIANGSDGTIKPASRPSIISHANEGLLRLYARYVIKESYVWIQMHEHITRYQISPRLTPSYVPTGPSDNEPIRYIINTSDRPFDAGVIKILSIFDTDGYQIPLNDRGAIFSVFTPQPNLLQVPNPKHGRVLNVSYQAKHAVLQDELEEAILLPDILWGALTAFVAYKVFSHMNTADSTAKAKEHLSIYEAICSEAVGMDLVNTTVSNTSNRFHNRGWI